MDDTPISSAEDDASALRKKGAPREADPHDFGAAEDALNDAARRVNGIWIAFILLCVYIFIATYTITPAALFRETPVRLPIFNADLPLKVYFVMAPFLILAMQAYLIVLTKGLAEKLAAYEDVLKRSAINADGQTALRTRLDNSIIMRAMGLRYHDALGDVVFASNLIAEWTMVVLPVALLLLTQLVFLPRQEESITWVHRTFISVNIIMCVWLFHKPFNTLKRLNIEGRSMVGFIRFWIAVGQVMIIAFVSSAWVTSVFFAAFPGEVMYMAFDKTPVHDATVWAFEGTSDPMSDPINHVTRSSNRWFPNRLILPDDPKLAEVAGASARGVSLSVRGRNFRKAVFDRSNLARVDFSAADLQEASLDGAKLEGAKFECATPGTFFAPESAPKVTMWVEGSDCAKLERAKLWNATLGGASFRGARMSGAFLENTTVNRADFRRATLLGAFFSNAHGSAVDFSSALLMGADLQYSQLRTANFTGAGLQGARLSNSYLQVADFRDAYLQGVDMNNASLQGASFEKTFLQAATFYGAKIQGASFKSAALPNASLECAEFFRSDFKNADIYQTIVTAPTEKKCGTLWTFEPNDYYQDPDDIRYKYNLSTDALPKKEVVGVEGGYGFSTSYSDYPAYFIPALEHPEKLTANTFAAVLDRLTSDLPDDDKSRVRQAFECLKPGARTKEQDDAEKVFWADWTRQSAPQESHDKALAERLLSIACVAEGAPYVARGLLRAGRFDRLYQDKETNEKEKNRILERLRKASGGGDPSCLGAKGLVIADFPKPAP